MENSHQNSLSSPFLGPERTSEIVKLLRCISSRTARIACPISNPGDINEMKLNVIIRCFYPSLVGTERGETMASIKDNIENVALSFLNHPRSGTVLSPTTTGRHICWSWVDREQVITTVSPHSQVIINLNSSCTSNMSLSWTALNKYVERVVVTVRAGLAGTALLR